MREGSVWDLKVWGVYSGCVGEQVCVWEPSVCRKTS